MLRNSHFSYIVQDHSVVVMFTCSFIVAFLENATVGYSIECVCVCVCVCVSMFVCVCVFLHDNSKKIDLGTRNWNFLIVYENSLDKFDIELHRIKVKVTVGV